MIEPKILHIGKLTVKRNDNSRWKVGDVKFTMNHISDRYVFNGLMKARREGRTVEIWLSKRETLLSMRVLE